MLKKLRKKKIAKKIWIILAILIVPAFVLWGSGSLIRSKQEDAYVGRIFGRKISSLEYRDAVEATKNQAIIQFGDNLAEIEKYLDLESQAWERLILLREAKKRKIKASDKEVIESIRSYPFFQNKKGQFDNTVYSSALRYFFRTQSRIFEEQTRQNIMLSKFYKEVTDNLNLTDEEIKEAYRKANEKISIHYITSLYADFLKDLTADEAEIKDYFAKNSLLFKQPLSFNIEYVSITYEDKDEKVTKDKIKQLSLRLKKGKGFAEVAKEFGLEAKETGLFRQTDPIPGIGWAGQILSLLSKAKVGKFLPPIQMDKYYYILRLKEKKEPYIPELPTIKEKVKEALIKDKAQKLAKEKIEKCLEKLKAMYQANPNSIDFDNIAKEYALKSGSTDFFKYGGYIESIGVSDNFWLAAQGLKENEFSKIIDMGLSGLYIIQLKSKIPAEEKKFQEEKTEFTKKLLLQKKQEYFTRVLGDLKRKSQAF